MIRLINVVKSLGGKEVLRGLKAADPNLATIVTTDHSSLENALAALEEGADAYLKKPLDREEVLTVAGRAIERQKLALENRRMLADLSLVSALSTTLGQALEPEDVLGQALDRLLEKMELDAGGIELREKASGEPILSLHRTGKAGAEGLQLLGCVPLEARGGVMGVMTFAGRGRRPLPSQDLQLLSAIARQISLALENIRLHQTLNQKAEGARGYRRQGEK